MSNSNDSQTLTLNKNSVTVFQSYSIGLVLGFIEVFITQPLFVLKTLIQQQKKVDRNLKSYYRGYFTNVASFGPAMAMQMGTNKALNYLTPSDYQEKTSLSLINAFMAGASSAIILTPSEMVMTWQGLLKKKPIETMQYLYQKKGCSSFYKGVMAIALREGVFAIGFLELQPYIEKKIHANISNKLVSYTLSGVIAGFIATMSSQAYDVIKTSQQYIQNPEETNTNKFKLNARNFLTTTQHLYKNGGSQRFFSGFTVRAPLIMASVTIMSAGQEVAEDLLKKSR
jgi:hypothetical protein